MQKYFWREIPAYHYPSIHRRLVTERQIFLPHAKLLGGDAVASSIFPSIGHAGRRAYVKSKHSPKLTNPP